MSVKVAKSFVAVSFGTDQTDPAMFIAVLGSTCSGKRTVVQYLKSRGFFEISMHPPVQSGLDEDSQNSRSSSSATFASGEALLDYVTRRWREHYVCLVSEDDILLSELSVRPFFLVVNVDAPIMHRWRRLQLVGHSRDGNSRICNLTPSLLTL